MADPQDWHQLFGLCLADFFAGTPFVVEREKDLSIRQQLLDVVIIRPDGAELPRRLPDGFEGLAAHNLITFKSHREPLGTWPLCELVGHYVNYRKQSGPNMRELPPETDFRLFAVAARWPEALASRVGLTEVQPGVYALDCLGLSVRIIVVNRLPREEHNAMLLLYTAEPELVRYGASHYQPYSDETSNLLWHFVQQYRGEGLSIMAESLQEFARRTRREMAQDPETRRELLAEMTPEQRVEGLTPEQLEALLEHLKENRPRQEPSDGGP